MVPNHEEYPKELTIKVQSDITGPPRKCLNLLRGQPMRDGGWDVGVGEKFASARIKHDASMAILWWL